MGDDSENRLFALQEHDFSTGACSDGRQVVMGFLCPNVVAYFFDSQGNMLGSERRRWKKEAPRMSKDGPYRITQECQDAVDAQLREWQSEIGFESRTIHVREFWDAPIYIGIQRLPEHLRDLDTADYLDDFEREEQTKEREECLAQDKFVWCWSRDYWVDENGEAEST